MFLFSDLKSGVRLKFDSIKMFCLNMPLSMPMLIKSCPSTPKMWNQINVHVKHTKYQSENFLVKEEKFIDHMEVISLKSLQNLFATDE